MATVRDERRRFPRMGFREVLGEQEAYLSGLGGIDVDVGTSQFGTS